MRWERGEVMREVGWRVEESKRNEMERKDSESKKSTDINSYPETTMICNF